MRIAVTGRDGQVARSLIERAAGTDVDVIPVGRPALDLANPDTIDGALAAIAADVLVSAAAYTDVNKAEAEPELADLINGRAAGLLAARTAALGIPLIHLSTDYVFDGTKAAPYVEGDTIARSTPTAAPRRRASARSRRRIPVTSSCGRRGSIARSTAISCGPCSSSPASRTPCASCPTRSAIRRPLPTSQTASSRWRAVSSTDAARSATAPSTWRPPAARPGRTSPQAVFAASAARGGPTAHVVPIASAEYQTPARRPANSRLDCAKIARVHGVALPPWQPSLDRCVGRILEQGA